MKRYLVFTGYAFYPGGGWDDFKGSFDTIEEAREAFPTEEESDKSNDDWRQIVDCQTGTQVAEAGYAYGRY